MFKPIMTPSQTAVILAEGSASRIGATIGTTTTAISMKSRKKPRTKITAMTMTNLVQKPPGRLVRKSRTRSSPPNARKAAVSMAAPSRMMNTSEVVLAVSTITPRRASSTWKTRQPLQITETRKPATAMETRKIANASRPVSIRFTLIGVRLRIAMIASSDNTASAAGRIAPRRP